MADDPLIEMAQPPVDLAALGLLRGEQLADMLSGMYRRDDTNGVDARYGCMFGAAEIRRLTSTPADLPDSAAGIISVAGLRRFAAGTSQPSLRRMCELAADEIERLREWYNEVGEELDALRRRAEAAETDWQSCEKRLAQARTALLRIAGEHDTPEGTARAALNRLDGPTLEGGKAGDLPPRPVPPHTPGGGAFVPSHQEEDDGA